MPREFVLIRLYRLGDIIMSTALARAWKQEAPTHVTWIVSEDCAALLQGQPYIDRLIVVPLEFITKYRRRAIDVKEAGTPLPVAAAKAEFAELFAEFPQRADRVVNLQFNTAAALIAGAIETDDRRGPYAGSQGEQRVPDLWSQYYGVAGADARFSTMNWVDAFINIGGAARTDIRTEFAVQPDPAFAQQFQQALGGKAYFTFQVGSFEDQKRWHEKNYSELAVRLVQQSGMAIVLVGGKSERILNLHVQRAVERIGGSVVNLAGETNFHQLAQALQGAAVLIGNDTFTQHLAGAIGAPIATIFQGNPCPWQTLAYREGAVAIAEEDGSPPEVERVIGVLTGQRADALIMQKRGSYMFPVPMTLQAQSPAWNTRWIVGSGHLRALDPSMNEVGREAQVGFPKQWLAELYRAAETLDKGGNINLAELEAKLTVPDHPLWVLTAMFMMFARFSDDAKDPRKTAEFCRWLYGGLQRAGRPE
ncbi:MAG: glycosyltransferase family 9 protein [Candidatus Poribacteria bacterium]|nr:glycosyltransferase family 9 protein [Candidatus Poribacteria bacterium]